MPHQQRRDVSGCRGERLSRPVDGPANPKHCRPECAELCEHHQLCPTDAGDEEAQGRGKETEMRQDMSSSHISLTALSLVRLVTGYAAVAATAISKHPLARARTYTSRAIPRVAPVNDSSRCSLLLPLCSRPSHCKLYSDQLSTQRTSPPPARNTFSSVGAQNVSKTPSYITFRNRSCTCK